MEKLIKLTLFLFIYINKVNTEPQVHFLSENLEQTITSSTLEWKLFNLNLIDNSLKNAVIGAYQIKINENVTTDSDENEFIKLPIYICRAKMAALWVPGQYRLNDNYCIISFFKKVIKENNFEILINREKRSRLNWIQKNKFMITPPGSIEGGDKIYISRRSVKFHQKNGALTHTIGNFNPNENLGVFSLVDQNNKELKYEDGEILIEVEPIRYEFTKINFDKFKSKIKENPRILGKTILKNEEFGVQRVDTVLSFNYTSYIHWGKDHGLLISLPFKSNLLNNTKFNGNWGMPESYIKTIIVPIEKHLNENTGINVTLHGNYTESDIPYTSTVTAFFKDNYTHESILKDSLIIKNISGVIVEFSPPYFLNNLTLVPVITTTTTTTTTTLRTTTQTIKIPLITDDVYVVDKSDKPMINSNEILSSIDKESNNVVQELIKKTNDDNNNGSSVLIISNLLFIFIILIHIT